MTLHSLAPRTPIGWIIAGLLTAGAGFALAAHWNHSLVYLPYLLILACPLMHLFMHGGHGGHAGHHDHQDGTQRQLPSGNQQAAAAAETHHHGASCHGEHGKETSRSS